MKTLTAILESGVEDYSPIRAGYLLGDMGGAARDAVPALCRAIERDDERTCAAAAQALGSIRAQPEIAVPALMKALKWRGNTGPDVAAEALAKFRGDAKAAVPALKELAKQVKEHERVAAAYALWRIEGKSDTALPILIDELRSDRPYWAIRRLGDIGPPAKAAVPDLTRMLKNEDDSLIAAQALWRITQKPEPALSMAIRVLENQDARQDHSTAIDILMDMGPHAKPAVPALLEIHRSARKKADSSLQDEVEKALRKIDPAAAEKAGIR